MLNVNVECQCGATDWLHMAAQGVPMAAVDPIWLLRGCFWVPLGLHIGAQRLHMAAHGVHMAAERLLWGALGGAYGRSEAP